MGEYIFKMPDIGEGVTEAEIVSWHIKPSDKVRQDDPICDAMTDKATVELTAPVSGLVKAIGCAEGEVMAIGGDLVVFEVAGEVDSAPKKARPQKPAVKPETKPVNKPAAKSKPKLDEPKQQATKPASPSPVSGSNSKPLASPAVRKRAAELGIDLSLIPASGKAGQVTHEDLDNFQKAGTVRQKLSGGQEIKVTGLRRVISERMSEAKRKIPHFSYVEAVDMTAIEELRAHMNKNRQPHQPKLTLLPFFMLAIVKAVKLWPGCNATFDDEAGVVTRHNPVHIGMAAQTENGLMVPVVRHAEAKDIWGLMVEVNRLGEQAKSGSIAASDLSGSTITLTSLGRLAGVIATPVINRPEVAILCPNKIVETPVVKDGAITIRKMMNFSSSFDHRVVDGSHAAEMLNYIKGILEQPATLFMDEV